MRTAALACCLAVAAAGCRQDGAPRWSCDYDRAATRAAGRGALLVVHFELPGRPLSDAMALGVLAEPRVLAALDRHDAEAVRLPAERHPGRYARLAGGRAGLATCVVEPGGEVIARSVGYADAAGLAAFVDLAADRATALRAAWRLPAGPARAARLAAHYLELGCRRRAAALAEQAMDGPLAARLALAFATDGRLAEARAWLDRAPPELVATAHAAAAIAFAARRPARAVELLEPHGAAAGGEAALLLAAAYHEARRDGDALALLAGLRSDAGLRPRATDLLDHLRSDDEDHAH